MLDSQKRAAAGVVGRRLELREAACRRKRAMSSAAIRFSSSVSNSPYFPKEILLLEDALYL